MGKVPNKQTVAAGAILRLELDVCPDGSTLLRTVCDATAPFEEVTKAFRAAAREIGTQIRERARCPFHPDHPSNPMREEDRRHGVDR